ncbi:MAG: BACON domain-containing protein [Bacteroidaceae bacterium]|nr:BACON domain-containing protein [Bacteroidaceae bacterium]
MKQYYHLSILPLLFLLVVACSEDSAKTPELEVTPTLLEFPSEGGFCTFEIKSNTNWTITYDNPDMLVSPQSGSYNKTVTVTLPASSSIEELQYLIAVKPEGGVATNVRVKQAGQFISGDVTLKVNNYEGYVTFGGEGGDLDSLRIMSNVSWLLYGPEWIEAWDGKRWVPLSQTSAVIKGSRTTDKDAEGTMLQLLRTKSSNTSEDYKMADLILKPAYSGTDVQVTLTALQLGRHMAVPNYVVSLSDGIATDWEVGADVKTIGVYLSDKPLGANDPGEFEATEPDYISYWDSLQENTTYYLYSFGVGSDLTSMVPVQTGSSMNQPLAEIQNVNMNFDKNEWTWQVKMNEYCSGYRMWSFSAYFDYPDVVLAWLLGLYTQDESRLSEFPIYTTDKSFNWVMDSPRHMQVVTWAGGKGSNHYASVIDRYNSTTDERYNDAPRRAADRKPSYGSLKVYRDEIRKSIIRIK